MVHDVLYCRAWNVAATDDKLWRTQFLSLFGTSNLSLNLVNVAGISDAVRKPNQDVSTGQVLQKPPDNSIGVWRKAFNIAQKGMMVWFMSKPHLKLYRLYDCFRNACDFLQMSDADRFGVQDYILDILWFLISERCTICRSFITIVHVKKSVLSSLQRGNMVGGAPLETCQGQVCCKEADLGSSFASANVCQPGVSHFFPSAMYKCFLRACPKR